MNGVLLTYNVDYTIAGTTLTFLSDPPCPTDGILFYGSLGYTVIPATVTVSGDTTSYTEIDYLHFVNTIVSNPQLGVAKVTPKTSVQSVIKLLDETRNNNTTANDDSELYFSLEAGGKYSFQFFLMGTTTAAGDIKFTINYGGIVSSLRFSGPFRIAATASVSSSNSVSTAGTTISVAGASTGQFFIDVKGSIICNTSGTMAVGWAQVVSDGGPTTVFANSYGVLFKQN